MRNTSLSLDHPSARWLKRLERGGRPLYLALVEALDGAIRDGELQAGDQLPPQRAVAALIGADFTTVTRAYGAARARGLVQGAVGRGTFVRARAADDETGRVDLSMNLPPPPQGVSLSAMLKDTTRAVLERTDTATLMAYHPGAGTLGQRAAAAAWLAPCLGEVDPDRVLICPGAQTALSALLATLAGPGDAVIVEPLTYPGLKAIAEELGLRLLACPVDEQGFEPQALARLGREAKGLYLIPSLQNPTASTMGLDRRREVAAIARTHDLWILEDDPYSRLFDIPLPAVTSFAPERSFYVATLSKTLSPGLRTAFLVTPQGPLAELAAASLRATSLMPAPLMTAVVTSWIREGAAEKLLAGVRREARERRAIAARLLPMARGAAEGLHVWLDLPQGLRPDRLRALAQARGLSLVTAEAFAVGETWPEGVRISLGGPARQAVLEEALRNVAGLLAGGPATGRVVV
jgi:DNA-binding transcriptional MocR family regulator